MAETVTCVAEEKSGTESRFRFEFDDQTRAPGSRWFFTYDTAGTYAPGTDYTLTLTP